MKIKPKMTHRLKLADKKFKIAVITLPKDIKEKSF